LSFPQMRSRCCWPIVLGLLAGCDGGGGMPPATTPASPKPSAPATTTRVENAPPGVVELTSATARLDSQADTHFVRFEIAYKFTSGSPVKHYMVEIAFPGTTNHGVKPMDAWEVKPEGVIKTGIQVADDTVKEYSITFAEADSPDRGYKVISNTLTGVIEPPPAAQ